MNTLNLLIAERIDADLKSLARAIVNVQYQQHPDLWERYGNAGFERAVRDTELHLPYLAEAIASSSVHLWIDYLQWANVHLVAFGFSRDDFLTNLEAMASVLKSRLLASEVPVVSRFMDDGLDALYSTAPPRAYMDATSPHGELASRYLTALLDGSQSRAERIIFEAVEAGTAIRDIYLHVFQPVQYELGRRWQQNEISVAHEHYCTAITEQIAVQLSALQGREPATGYSLIAACIDSELHDFGLRVVTDFFVSAGWEVFYLGANTPTESLLVILSERQPDVLALSVTMTTHLGKIREVIAAVRSREDLATIKIIVGGYPFSVSPLLWREIGADGCALDSDQAVKVAHELVES